MKGKAPSSVMEEPCMIEVFGQLESDSETILKPNGVGTIVYKHMACQTTSTFPSEALVPIMFCTMFSPICEASVQVNLPIVSTGVNDVGSLPTVTPSFGVENEEFEYKPLDQADSVKKRKISFETETCSKVKSEIDSAHSDSQEPETDALRLSPIPEEEYVEKDTEDSEYNSENDFAFWQKMNRLVKRKSKKSRNRLYRKHPLYKMNFKNIRDHDLTDEQCNDQQSKQCNEAAGESGTAVKGPESEDDWITDDEMDDDDQEDIDLAFKREWKERRLPNHTKEKNFICEICGKRYSKHVFLRGHLVREHKEHEEAKKYPYSCEHCKKVYMEERHLLKHHQQHSGPCEICGVVMKCSNLFWAHRRNHDSVCNVCGKSFTSRAALDLHEKMNHSGKAHPCLDCNKIFPFPSILNRHIAKVHEISEQTKYKCDTCGFGTSTEVALKIHKTRMHNPKPAVYNCKECKKAFTSRLTCKKHVANHAKKNSITCPICSQKFASQDELQTHRKSIHGITDKVHSIKETVSSHVDSSHVAQYLCTVCHITLDSIEGQAQHMQQYHDMDIDSPRDITVQIEPFQHKRADKK